MYQSVRVKGITFSHARHGSLFLNFLLLLSILVEGHISEFRQTSSFLDYNMVNVSNIAHIHNNRGASLLESVDRRTGLEQVKNPLITEIHINTRRERRQRSLLKENEVRSTNEPSLPSMPKKRGMKAKPEQEQRLAGAGERRSGRERGSPRGSMRKTSPANRSKLKLQRTARRRLALDPASGTLEPLSGIENSE